MYKIRFTLNQIGMAFEAFTNGDWRTVLFLNTAKLEQHGGASLAKSKILLGITDRYELTPAGEYSENGITINCI